ncbi:MAG: 1-acyl-sn-glycerol-3-phosphate acyltransferase [Deltaproteobacteria bacterium]|nr:1-acyl-sn-glycerol-3-phosphate acyltransferase [Deltaproteobacteria bacterium]
MDLQVRRLRDAVVQWGPFVARTAGYGALSCALGPLSPRRSVSTWCMHRWCVTAADALGIRIALEGAENVPTRDRPAVLVANHQSTLDILVLGAVLPIDYKWAAKKSLFWVPLLGWHLAISGHVPIDRSKKNNAETVARRFDRALADGASLLMFPEGTRSEDGVMRPFRAGAFLSALRADVPIVPVVLDGTHWMMRKGEPIMDSSIPRDVRVRVLPAIPPHEAGTGTMRDRIDRLRATTHERMAVALEQIGGRVERGTSRVALDEPSLDLG